MKTVNVTICGIETVVPRAWRNWVCYLADTPRHVFGAEYELGRARQNTPAYLKYWQDRESTLG